MVSKVIEVKVNVGGIRKYIREINKHIDNFNVISYAGRLALLSFKSEDEFRKMVEIVKNNDDLYSKLDMERFRKALGKTSYDR